MKVKHFFLLGLLALLLLPGCNQCSTGLLVEDYAMYVYDFTIHKGSVTYTDGNGDETQNVLFVRSSPSSDGKLNFDIFFENTPFALRLMLSYNRGAFSLDDFSGKSRFNITKYDAGDFHVTRSWSFSHGYNLVVDSQTENIIDRIDFSVEDDLDLSGAEGFSQKIKSIDIDMTTSEYSYVAHNIESGKNINTVRYMNTYDIIKNVPAEIDNGLKSDPGTYAPQLVDYLTTGVSDPSEKIKIIHDWISDNIYYDMDSYLADEDVDQRPYPVLKTRLTTCGGYARVFRMLCREAGVPVVFLHGDAKGYNYREKGEVGSHGWNLVQINDQYYSIDPTWNAGGYLRDGAYTEGLYGSGFLFVKPKYAIHTHFPTIGNYQCLEVPISSADFLSDEYSRVSGISDLYENFHREGLEISSGVKDIYDTTNGPAEVTFSNAAAVDYISFYKVDPYAESSTKFEHQFLFRETGGVTTLSMQAPEEGYYRTILYKKEEDTYRHIGSLISYSSAAPAGDYPYPEFFPAYYDFDASLEEPLQGELTPGESYSFTIQCAAAVSVGLWEWNPDSGYTKRIVYFDKSDDVFSESVSISGTQPMVAIGIDDDDVDTKHNFVAAFRIEGASASIGRALKPGVTVLESEEGPSVIVEVPDIEPPKLRLPY